MDNKKNDEQVSSLMWMFIFFIFNEAKTQKAQKNCINKSSSEVCEEVMKKNTQCDVYRLVWQSRPSSTSEIANQTKK